MLKKPRRQLSSEIYVFPTDSGRLEQPGRQHSALLVLVSELGVVNLIHQELSLTSLSVRSPALYSSKTIRIRHTNLCHPSCKHKHIW